MSFRNIPRLQQVRGQPGLQETQSQNLKQNYRGQYCLIAVLRPCVSARDEEALPGMLSYAESGVPQTLGPRASPLWSCISKHTILQQTRTKLLKMESFLRLTSQIRHQQTSGRNNHHSPVPVRYYISKAMSVRFYRSIPFLIISSPGSQPLPFNSLSHLWEGFKMNLQKEISITYSQYHRCLLN